MRSKDGIIWHNICVLLLGAALLLAVNGPAAAGQAMPAFSLSSALDGKTLSSKDFKGKILLITFFTTWCPPCREEIPTLIQLQNDYAAKGFSVIGLSMDEKGASVVAKLIEKESINYPVLMADQKTARDFGGIVGIPTTFLVDREGMVVRRYPGYAPRSLLVKDIDSIIIE
ncbi:MAG TPA: TlpA family protein disulfide reductase [Desulfobulbaceae bacterium]|nr:TlpA family protein disulfide reductase [Desulfobulbaceae bacterium]